MKYFWIKKLPRNQKKYLKTENIYIDADKHI